MFGFAVDDFALAGYQYALGVCQHDAINFNHEIDVLAFNAGISQANTRHNLSISKLDIHTSRFINRSIQATDKEIQTGVYHG